MLNDIRGYWSEVLKRVGRMSETVPVPQLAPELQGEISVDADPTEWWLLKQKRLIGHSLNIGALAANVNFIEIRNPAGSNMLTVIEGVHVISTANSFGIYVPLPDSALIGAAPLRFQVKDNRGQNTTTVRTAQTIGYSGQQAAVAGTAQCINLTSGVIFQPDPAVAILRPNSSLYVFTEVVNIASTFNIWGYERLASPEELSVGQ